ncbi:MAG: PAS domain-containing hybrid sensor histidine kinase/response regulator [Alphaproteobacteria bacterium]|nr:PAS domain-containing hybrid sensor histidine kinase/response regulator [Alphaproteobacteria bacterium]
MPDGTAAGTRQHHLRPRRFRSHRCLAAPGLFWPCRRRLRAGRGARPARFAVLAHDRAGAPPHRFAGTAARLSRPAVGLGVGGRWEGCQTYVSPGFTRATGVPVEQVLGRSRAEALAGRVDGRDMLRHARDLRARRPFDDLVAQHVRPGGQRTWIRSSGVPRYDARGRFVGYIGTSEDITREIEADRRLADFRTMLEHVFAQVPDALVLVDADSRIVGSNAALSALTGLAPEELLGRKGGEFLKVHGSERDIEPHHCPFGFPRPGPAMLHRNDGGLVPVEVVGSPIRTGDGPAIGACALVRDRRGTVAAERPLAAARDAAEQAPRTKSEFLAQVSHELRTPLNAILGFAEILSPELYGPLGDGRYRGYARDIHSSGTHLLAVINDLLDLSRVEARRLTINESAFSVDTVVAESVRLVSDACRLRARISVGRTRGRRRKAGRRRTTGQADVSEPAVERRAFHPGRRQHRRLGQPRRQRRISALGRR